ncbi:hypothetical protein [Actinocrispum wychmicini]|uniref:nSTAND1 domain-containing NTPase n=1 Tax=Actinocrispum wychmicini TaxID=1213861 RepID=UPI00312CA481
MSRATARTSQTSDSSRLTPQLCDKGRTARPEADERRRVAAAISRPAAVAGLDMEPGLVELLMLDVGDGPGALPLLSQALLAK